MRRDASSPLPWLGGLLVVYLAFPLVAFLDRVVRGSDRGFGESGLWSALEVSIQSATISLVLITLVGVPLAWALAHHRGRIATIIGIIVQIPLALPPLMSGILIIYVAGPYSFLGRHFSGGLTESLTGVVIAQTFVSAPFLVIAARSAFATVDPTLGDLAATLGHGPLSRFFRIDVRCASAGIRAGMVLFWLRAFGEYGATVIVAYHPFTLPIYTDNQFETSPLSTSEAPTILALVAAAVVIVIGQTRIRMPLPARGLPAPRPPVVAEATAVGFALDTKVGEFHLHVDHPVGAPRLAIVGPSGSGKSMTLRSLAGLLGSDAGSVTFGERDVTAVPPERRRVGYVPQGFGLVPGLNVRRQILFGRGADPALAAWWVSTLQLDGLLDRLPDQLSGGQRQRVSLARALACEPSVLLLDEPFSALDAPVRDDLRRELRRLQQVAGLSVVLVTHDPREAAFLADEVMVISNGAVLQAGPVATVFRRPETTTIARLLGVENVAEAVVESAGSIRLAWLELPTDLPAGTDVLWSVLPDRVQVTASSPDRSATQGQIVDVVDLGVAYEVTVLLNDGLQLRARQSEVPDLTPGSACAITVNAEDIALWPVQAR